MGEGGSGGGAVGTGVATYAYLDPQQDMENLDSGGLSYVYISQNTLSLPLRYALKRMRMRFKSILGYNLYDDLPQQEKWL